MEEEDVGNCVGGIILAVAAISFFVFLYFNHKMETENETKITIEAISKGYVQEVHWGKVVWTKELEK